MVITKCSVSRFLLYSVGSDCYRLDWYKIFCINSLCTENGCYKLLQTRYILALVIQVAVFIFCVHHGRRTNFNSTCTTDENSAHALVKDLWDEVLKQEYEKFKDILTSPSHLLFDAAESGNSKFVVQLIHDYPHLIWETTDDDRKWTIIHAAVNNRNERIFSLIYEIGLIKDVIATYRDKQTGYTLLHLAAKLAPASQLNKLPGAAFQMQRELLWFEVLFLSLSHSHIINFLSKSL